MAPKQRQPSFQPYEFNPEKDIRSVNIFYYGILLDCLYVNGIKFTNVQIYMSEEDTSKICLLKFNQKKIEKQLTLDILKINGISEKPLKEIHKKIYKIKTDNVYLAIQTDYLYTDISQNFNEFLFVFQFESIKKIFWQGIKNIISKQKKKIDQLVENIKSQLKEQSTRQEIKDFLKEIFPFVQDNYLNKLIAQQDHTFQDCLEKDQVVKLYELINISPDLLNFFQKACANQVEDIFRSIMTFQEFQIFQIQIQKDKPYEDIILLAKLRKFDSFHDVRLEKLSFYDFCCLIKDDNYLLQDYNPNLEKAILTDFFIFNKIFVGKDLQETVKITLDRNCIFFEFELLDGPQFVPMFKIRAQQAHALHILDILNDHVTSSDLPLIISFNCKCSNEQQQELVQLILKKYENSIYRDSTLAFSSLGQKIIFLSLNATNKQLKSILFGDYNQLIQEEAEKQFETNQKNFADNNRKGLNHIKGKSFKVIDYFQTGCQIINLNATNIENLLYISKFQNINDQFYPLVEKPVFMTQKPFKYCHKDFIRIKKLISFIIIFGFQLGADNVYLDISIQGINSDFQRTSIIQTQVSECGFNAVFNQKVEYDLNCNELAQILIQVYEKVYGGQDRLLSWVAFNVDSMKLGIRKLNLRNLDFEWEYDSFLIIFNQK